jgi:hypothetical protein
MTELCSLLHDRARILIVTFVPKPGGFLSRYDGQSTGFCQMTDETKLATLACIVDIVTTLGQKDYEEFRQRVGSASILLTNMGIWTAKLGALSYDGVSAWLDGRSEAEQQWVLQLMRGLKEYLPTIGVAITTAAKVFPQRKGERSTALKEHSTEREACELIWHRIRLGDTEPQAKRYAAGKFGASPRTVHRIWKKRRELLAEKSFEEFFGQLLKTLSAAGDSSAPTDSEVSLAESRKDLKPIEDTE